MIIVLYCDSSVLVRPHIISDLKDNIGFDGLQTYRRYWFIFLKLNVNTDEQVDLYLVAAASRNAQNNYSNLLFRTVNLIDYL